ncbi:SDR family NAD(P)-dependent oxidoreductase [Streptococcus dysgalactiae]
MKVVVITGGKSGIGNAAIDIFLKNNYQVVVLDKEEIAISHPKLFLNRLH